MARAIKRVEPGWRYTYGWCTCPRSVSGQVWRDIGTWERTGKDGKRESVDVWVVLAGSAAESEEWMDRWAHVISHTPDQTESYPRGDEAYLSKGPTTFRRILNCRKGRYLITVRGDSQELVERFAKYALMRLKTG